MGSAIDKSTKDRILDAAERAIADSGFDGASMRQIVLDAKVNLATVYYHFESKEGLMVAVLKRRFDPLKVQQLELLTKPAQKSSGESRAIERVLHAMISPFLGVAKSTNAIELRLIGRLMTKPNPQIQELLCRQYDDVRGAFLKAFQGILPKLSTTELLWRMECAWGALAALLCNPAKIKQRTGGCCDPTDSDQLLAHLLPFLAAGFRAPTKSSAT